MFNLLDNVITSSTNSHPEERLDRFDSISSILGFVANVAVGVSFSLAIISLGYAFIQYVISSGDPKAIQKAQSALIYAVISAVVSILAFAIKTVVLNAMGVQSPDLQNGLPNL